MFEIGNTLREARRRQGLDLATCEAATKIRLKYLAALEEEQFEILPEPAYVRGFLRTYADFLDVDPRLILEEYASRNGEETEDPPPPGPPEAPPGRIGGAVRRFVAPRPQRRARGSTLRWLALGGVLVLGLLIWAGVGRNDHTTVVPGPGAHAAPPAAVAPVAKAPTPRPPAAAVPPAKPAAAVLQVSGVAGTNGSYLQVRQGGVEGPLLYEGTVEPGTTKSWRAAQGLWIRVGWTPSLQARVNGRPVTLAGGTANFMIDRQGTRPAA